MGLNEEQVQKLLEWFVTTSETKKAWTQFRYDEYKKNSKWLKPDIISNMSEDELKEKFFEYYRSGGGRQSLNQINREKIINDTRLKDVLLYLLNEKYDIKKRINAVLSGEKHIGGMGKAIVTSILMDFNCKKYCLWNGKTMMGFNALDWEIDSKNLDDGQIYLNVLESLQKLKNLSPEYNLNFQDVDLFLHTISATDEGIDAVSTVIQGEDITSSDTDVKDIKNMEFVMERYLEEFIESNFDKIDFGADLKLYQDEENTGRQYSTSVGTIDLLAVDHKKGEYIVIELKKGRSSDVVVGQISRYMGWVKENLADNYNVRGIIIAKEKDKRLEYSLKLIPQIELYLYNVFFEINKIN